LIRAIALGCSAILATVILLVVVLAVAGYPPLRALSAFWDGSFGSWYSLTSGTLVRATPLIIAGLATTVAFRGGVLNIGVEGQLLVGAAAATAVALSARMPDALLLPAAMAAGIGGGLAWASIPALLKRRRGVLEVISTLLLNAVALYLISWLVRAPLQEHTHTYPQSDLVRAAGRLPILIPGTRLHAGFAIALLLAVAGWWVMTRSAVGFRLRAAGANPFAAASAGQIDVPSMATSALLISGCLAGLAGAIEVHGVTYALYEGISPGYGYTAIAVALLARLDPRAIVPSAILFAALESGAGAMQRDAGIPAVLVRVVEALLIIAALVGDAWRRRAVSLAPASS
jgi:ABC-type uncharacterized transport system permease subunit